MPNKKTSTTIDPSILGSGAAKKAGSLLQNRKSRIDAYLEGVTKAPPAKKLKTAKTKTKKQKKKK